MSESWQPPSEALVAEALKREARAEPKLGFDAKRLAFYRTVDWEQVDYPRAPPSSPDLP